MDREGADFYGTLEEIRERLNCKPVPVKLPVGPGARRTSRDAFRGLIDLVAMQMLTFAPTSEGHARSPSRRFPPSCATRPSFGAGRCSTSSRCTATS